MTAAANAQLPVLVPADLLRFKSFRLVAEPMQYVASAEADWGTLQIFGTRVVYDLTRQAASDASTETVNAAEQSIEVGRQRYGAAYLVRLECKSPADRRCRDEGYARRLLEEAEIVGGSKGTAPPPNPEPPSPRGPVGASSAASGFQWDQPGLLLASHGHGNTGGVVYAPGIRFPVEDAPAYLGSMVYGFGGQFGPASRVSWKDPRNYRYPWQDNFCEVRKYVTTMCPGGHGHQGVDIRPATAAKAVHWAVAVEDGLIGSARGYTVSLLGQSGTRYDYLHLEMAKLRVRGGDHVKAGDRIGLISNNFGKTPTPVHLHFEVRQNLAGKGVIPVPPYMSLVRAYERL